MFDRKKLNNRRFHVTEKFKYEDDFGIATTWFISVGIDDDGRAKEIFCRGFKPGSEFEGLLDDICVLLSRLLQCGQTLSDLAETLAREESSKVSFVLNCALQVEEACSVETV